MVARSETFPIIDDFSHIVADWPAADFLEQRNAYDANDNLLYQGYAKAGSAEGDLAWVIWKFTWVAGTVSGFNMTRRQLASDEVKFDKSWTDRASYF